MLRDRFGDPAPLVSSPGRLSPEERTYKAVEALGARLGALIEEVRALANRPIPAPVVKVAPSAPEVSVNIDADDLAAAMKDAVRPPELDTQALALALVQALAANPVELSQQAIKALGSASSQHPIRVSVPNMRDIQMRDASHEVINPATRNEQETQTALLAEIKRGLTDYDQRFDYDGSDSQPSRVGYAPSGTATSAAAWTVYSYTYDGSDRVTGIAVTTGQVWAA